MLLEMSQSFKESVISEAPLQYPVPSKVHSLY